MNATSKRLAMGFLAACAVLAAPVQASAQGIESYSPHAWDYGDVAIDGSSAQQIFTVVSGGLCGGHPVTTDLTVYAIYLSTDPTGDPYEGDAFTITAYPDSYTVPVGTPASIEVTFTPSSLGMHEAYLYILSNACDGNAEIAVPIQGVGVPDEGEPTELMADLLAFFDESVSDGFVMGEGPGNSPAGRLNAFGNMLEAADDLIAVGEFELACQQLWDAHQRADGLQPPPDFVVGEAREVLAVMILEVIFVLECV